MSNQSLYAMYVIGTVESNCNWTAVNYRDPITLGMMQWYGPRAANLIRVCSHADADGYASFKAAAPELAGQAETDSIDFTTRYVTQAEGNAWVAWAQRTGNHQGQQQVWESDFNDYQGVCDRYGFPAGNMRERVFFMSMYHQSPVSALRVLGSVSATATLDVWHGAALNDGVLGAYPNRYNTVYNLLRDWDGQSAPPDFGQSGDIGTTPGGNPPTVSGSTDSTAWAEVRQDTIYVHDGSKVRTFYHTTAQNWIEKQTAGTPVDTGHQTGAGSSTGSGSTSKVVEWVTQRIGKYAYSQGPGRLDPESTGYTDCSGLWWRAYMDVTGVDVGTWTGLMAGRGTLIASNLYEGIGTAIAKVKAGDLLLLGDRPNFRHVEGFTDDGRSRTLSHGGPGNGPNYFDALTEAPYFDDIWEIRRYV